MNSLSAEAMNPKHADNNQFASQRSRVTEDTFLTVLHIVLSIDQRHVHQNNQLSTVSQSEQSGNNHLGLFIVDEGLQGSKNFSEDKSQYCLGFSF